METNKNSTQSPSGLFLSTVTALNNGGALLELDEALREATKATADLGGKSEITLKLKIKPNGQGVGETPLVAIGFDVSKKVPKKFTKESTFFVNDNGEPSRRNPDQASLSLSEIKGAVQDDAEFSKAANA